MAEENVNSLVIPAKSVSGGSVSSDTGCSIIAQDPGVSFSSGDSVSYTRRNSTGKTSSVNSKQKNVPHYLRASTGSCHDFCKYGRKQNLEEKKGFPLWKRTIRAPSDNQIFVVTAAQGERKKKTVFKHTTSADKRSPSLESRVAPVAVQSPDPPEIIKREILSSNKFEVSSKKELSSAEKKKRTEIASGKPSSLVEPEPMKQSKKKMSMLSEKHSPSTKPQVPKQSKKKTNSISEKRPLNMQPQIIKQSSPSYLHKSEKGMKVLSQKNSPSSWKQPITGKSLPSSQVPGDTDRRGRRKDYIKSIKNVAVSKSPVKKTVVPPTSSFSRRSSLISRAVVPPASSFSRRSSLSSRTIPLEAQEIGDSKLMPLPISLNGTQKAEGKETNTEKTPEKTLHVVKTETHNNPSELIEYSDVIQSLPSQSHPLPDSLSQPCSSSLSCQEVGKEEEEEEEVEEEEEEELEVEGEGSGYSSDKAEDFIFPADADDSKCVEGNLPKPRTKSTVPSESKDSMAVKLRFRRGRVVDIRSESSGPRRLRFRRARVMEDNHDSKNETRRKNFKKKGVDADGNVMSSHDKKVVLRHQDAKEKKDAQGLFNNVIEETANKLVESRKSKVKALVGAFETVISLQESKPSAQPVG